MTSKATTATNDLNNIMDGVVGKKLALFHNDNRRFIVRSILAGVYLSLGTAFAAAMGQRVETLAPGLGSFVFAMLFFIGLAAIVLLGAELATGNMMYLFYGRLNLGVSTSTVVKALLVCTIGNLIGAVIVGILLSQAEVFSGLTDASFISEMVNKKLHKTPLGLITEGIIANFVVNMAIVGVMLLKDYTAKFIILMFVIGMFVGLGTEHVIANFGLVSIVGFSSSPLPEYFDGAHIATNWVLVWLGNFLGGGILMGGTYAWLNKTTTTYRDAQH